MLIAAFIACQAPKQQEIQAAVVSARIEASEAGKTVMQQGGNAYDAMDCHKLRLNRCLSRCWKHYRRWIFCLSFCRGRSWQLRLPRNGPLWVHTKIYISMKMAM